MRYAQTLHHLTHIRLDYELLKCSPKCGKLITQNNEIERLHLQVPRVLRIGIEFGMALDI